jgi:cytoskeleton protein RodZ
MVWSERRLAKGMARDSAVAVFGEQLRREREQRGMDVEMICATTKVPVRHILALEAGALRDLPGGVFRRGFVRSYLGALGLEESSWMARFEESCRESGVREPGETAWTTFAENVKNSRSHTGRRSRSRSLWLALLLLLMAIAGWCGWRVATHQKLLPHPPRWKTLKSWVDNVSSR